MLRTDLLDVLVRVQRAVATRPSAPAFGAVFFDGHTATAWDNQLGVTTPCDLDIYGGVDFKLLQTWLKSTTGEEVVVASTGKAVLRCGRSTFNAPVLPFEDLLWDRAQQPGTEVSPVGAFADALKHVAKFAGEDEAHPWRSGVTLSFADVAEAYATDNITIGAASWGCYSESDFEIIVPVNFAQGVAALDQVAQVVCFEGNEHFAAVTCDDDTVLFTRVGHTPSVDSFRQQLMQVQTDPDRMVDVPEGFVAAVQSIQAVVQADELEACTLVVADGLLSVDTPKRSRVAVHYELPIEHGDVAVEVPATELLRCARSAGRMLITEQAVVFRSDVGVALVGCYQ